MKVKVCAIRTTEDLMRPRMDEKGLEGLARSMKLIGLINPIGVVYDDDGPVLVHGARRLAAAKMLEWEEIEVRKFPPHSETIETIKVMENREREDVNAIDEGRYYKTLLEKRGWTQAKLAEMLQMSSGFISQRVNSVEWPKSLREAVENGALSFSTAREIAGIHDYEHLLYIVVHAAKNGATPSIAREWRRTANLEYEARQRREGEGINAPLNKAYAEPLISCHPCDRKVSVNDSSTLTICTDCRDLIEAVRDQGLFRENVEKAAGGVSSETAVCEEGD